MLGASSRALVPALGLALGLIAILTLAAHGRGLDGDFVVDDKALIVANPEMSLEPGAARFFGGGMWSFSRFETDDRSLYRPLFLVFLAAQRDLFGEHSMPFHGVSLLLHLLNAGLLYLLLRRLPAISSDGVCLFTALLFAVHPVHVEAVAWISAQSHLWATCFLLLACHAHPSLNASRWKPASIVLALCFLAALLSQEISIAFLAPLLYVALAVRDRRSATAAVTGVVVSAAYLLVRQRVLGVSVPLASGNELPWRTVIEFAAELSRSLILPWPACFYVEAPATGLASWLSFAVLIVSIPVVLAAAVATVRARGLYLLGLIWLSAGILVALSGAFNDPPRFALRSLYWPSAGLCVLLAAALVDRPSLQRRGFRWLGGACLALLVVLSSARTAVWDSDLAASRTALECHPRSAVHHENAGHAHEDLGQLEPAERSYREAVRLASGEARVVNLENLGRTQAMRGDLSAAEATLGLAVEQAPRRSSLWVGLGNVAFARGDLEAATERYRRAYDLDDGNFEACYNLLLTLERLGRPDGDLARECGLDRPPPEMD